LSRKRVTAIFIIGILSGVFTIPPILSFLGIPSFNDFLINIFGEDNPFVLVIAILVISLVIINVYKKPKNKLN